MRAHSLSLSLTHSATLTLSLTHSQTREWVRHDGCMNGADIEHTAVEGRQDLRRRTRLTQIPAVRYADTHMQTHMPMQAHHTYAHIYVHTYTHRE